MFRLFLVGGEGVLYIRKRVFSSLEKGSSTPKILLIVLQSNEFSHPTRQVYCHELLGVTPLLSTTNFFMHESDGNSKQRDTTNVVDGPPIWHELGQRRVDR